jgi:hypothetical protein
MSTVTSRISNHSITLQNYPSSQLIVRINRSNQTIEEPIPASNLFDDQGSDSNMQDIVHRLCQQRSRLTEFYDAVIERQQTTPRLVTFINKIDQLINEYQSQGSSNLIIGNQAQNINRKFILNFFNFR